MSKNFTGTYTNDKNEEFNVSIICENGKPVVYLPEGETIEIAFLDGDDFITHYRIITDEETNVDTEDDEEEVEDNKTKKDTLIKDEKIFDDTLSEDVVYNLENILSQVFTTEEDLDSFIEKYRDLYQIEDFYEVIENNDKVQQEAVQILVSITRFLERRNIMETNNFYYDNTNITAGDIIYRYTNLNTSQEVKFLSVKDITEFLKNECYLTSGEIKSLLNIKMYRLETEVKKPYKDVTNYYIPSANLLVKTTWTFNMDTGLFDVTGCIYWYSLYEKCFYEFPLKC